MGAGALTLAGGAGFDIADLGALPEALDVTFGIVGPLEAGPVGDIPRLISGVEGVIGTAQADTLRGQMDAAAILLAGSGGDDLLTGGAGDTLEGGAGADVLTPFAGSAVVSCANATAAVVVDMADQDANSGEAAGDFIFALDLALHGSAFDDSLAGDIALEWILGGDGADTIQGRYGADTLDGGAGRDLVVLDVSGRIDLLLNEGGGAAEGDRFANFEDLHGSGEADTLGGTDGDDVISGGDGDDVLIGYDGTDNLVGGLGNDWADYAAAGTQLVEVNLATGQGSIDIAAGDRLSGIENLRGGAGQDRLIGDANGNILEGGEGPDKLRGGAGDDLLFGQAGDDHLQGGDGAVTLVGGLGFDLLEGGEGFDIVN